VEGLILSGRSEDKRVDSFKASLHVIKNIGMELQRENPSEWNNFLDAALG
jgi:hypothetical protein